MEGLSAAIRRFLSWLRCPIVLDALCVIGLLVYFLRFALPALAADFGDDEMINIYRHWQPGIWKILRLNLYFWRGEGRPGGALYYLPLYHCFSLNPLPFNAVRIIILTASIPLIYYLARLLSPSRAAAFLAVLAVCYHSNLAALVFRGAFIYDVLCGFFYFTAFAYYLRIREKGLTLGWKQVLVFLALYAGALNCKEMAVTLPVIALLYELLKCPRLTGWKEFLRRNGRLAIPALIAGAVTVPYLFGKTRGPNALASLGSYRPNFSVETFIASNNHFISQIFYCHLPSGAIGGAILVVIWGAVFAYAYLRGDRALGLMALWVVIVPLPLDFIALRSGGALYLVLFGWAMISAHIVSDLISLAAGCRIFTAHGSRAGAMTGAVLAGGTATIGAILAGGTTNSVRGTALGATVGAAIGLMSARVFRPFAVIGAAAALAVFTNWENHRFNRTTRLLGTCKSMHLIHAFQSLNLRPARHSKILLKPDKKFYENVFYPIFVAALVWKDRSLNIQIVPMKPPPDYEPPRADYIISFNEFDARFVSGPVVRPLAPPP
jgi:hypothetical protein